MKRTTSQHIALSIATALVTLALPHRANAQQSGALEQPEQSEQQQQQQQQQQQSALLPPAIAPSPPPPPPVFVRPAPPPFPPGSDEGASDSTVLGPKLHHGGYGGPEMKLTTLAADAAVLAGAQGGWILGHSVVLGGAGYTSVTEVISPSALQSTNGSAHLGLSYGGFRIGGVAAPRKVVHVTFGFLIGGGRALSETQDGTYRRSDNFFVIEPDVALEINLAKYVRLGLGGTFRFAGGTDVAGFTSTRLSGPSATATLRFGEF